MNCVFYGRAMYLYTAVTSTRSPYPPFQLFDTSGNQCGLKTDAHAPCVLEIEGQPVDWRQCPRVAEIRI